MTHRVTKLELKRRIANISITIAYLRKEDNKRLIWALEKQINVLQRSLDMLEGRNDEDD